MPKEKESRGYKAEYPSKNPSGTYAHESRGVKTEARGGGGTSRKEKINSEKETS